MGATSTIEWVNPGGAGAGATWTPIRMRHRAGQQENGKPYPTGHYCQKISPGCDHCYAGAQQFRFGGTDYPQQTTATMAIARGLVAAGTLYLDDKVLQDPLRWQRPRLIFPFSMTDWGGEWIPFTWLDQILAVMAATPRHLYLSLTKRPQRLAEYLTSVRGSYIWQLAAERYPHSRHMEPVWPLPNLWLGCTVESSAYAWRVAELAKAPAAVRWVSAEPLLDGLETLGLARTSQEDQRRYVDWLVVGGESGHHQERALVRRCDTNQLTSFQHGPACCNSTGYRPTHEALAQVRDLRDRAVAADVPFFFKQWGGPRAHAGGRILDGQTWDQYPPQLRTWQERVQGALQPALV